eukprot:13843538-Ditylum_brightwellii.AAC.1
MCIRDRRLQRWSSYVETYEASRTCVTVTSNSPVWVTSVDADVTQTIKAHNLLYPGHVREIITQITSGNQLEATAVMALVTM